MTDHGDVCGIGEDIFSTNDRYQNHVANQFKVRIGAEYGKFLKYHFDPVGGGLDQKKTVLRIECEALPKTEEAFLDGELYIRNAAQTVKLNTREAIAWRNNRNTT